MNGATDFNLYTLLASGFPDDLFGCCIETEDGARYSWNDLERASAMLANLLVRLGLAAGDRVAVQVDKSPEALLLYLATLRAGFVFLPLNTAYQAAEIDYFIGDAEPAVVVCAPANRGWNKLGLVLHKVTNPLFLGAMYAIAIVPTGLLMRAFGVDPMGMRREPKGTYWTPRAKTGSTAQSLEKPF